MQTYQVTTQPHGDVGLTLCRVSLDMMLEMVHTPGVTFAVSMNVARDPIGRVGLAEPCKRLGSSYGSACMLLWF
jgi:hypothetical protein